MLALETIRGVRIVADPATIDGMKVVAGIIVVRFAPDDAFVLLEGKLESVEVDAILVEESGFVGSWLTPAEVVERLLPHIEWPLPEARPALAQGLVAGVPAKLWLGTDQVLLLCAAPYAHDLAERLA